MSQCEDILDPKDLQTKDTRDVFALCPLDPLDEDLALHLLLLRSLLLRLVLLRRLLLLLRQFDAGKQLFKEFIVMCLQPFLAFGNRRRKLAVLWRQGAYTTV